MLEDKLHLGNTKKNEFSFGISLDLHYLCTQKTYGLEIEPTVNRTHIASNWKTPIRMAAKLTPYRGVGINGLQFGEC